MIRQICLLVLLLPAMHAFADDSMTAPAEAETTAEIIAAAEQEDVAGGLRTQPDVSTAEYRSSELKAFVVWYNPYSGVAACHAYIYVLDETRGVWVQKIARKYEGTHVLSVEVGETITIRDDKGMAILRYPES